MIQKLIDSYKLWGEYVKGFPKSSKYTLGGKIDELFLDALEAAVTAQYLKTNKKLVWIVKASAKLDMLKFFLRLSWEVKVLDTKKYIMLSEKLNETGRQLGGWLASIRRSEQRQATKQNSARN